MSKTTQIADLIAQGKSNAEIKDEVNCSKSLISQVRKNAPQVEDEITDEEQADYDSTPNAGFINKIDLQPDESLNTEKQDKKEKKFEVECGSCHFTWDVKTDDQITECPSCGCEF